MRVLYCAIDQTVPGTTGGSIHVRAVAEGLAALGHDVHVLAQPGEGGFPPGPVRWHALSPPFGRPQLRWMRRRQVAAVARTMRADVVMERYYNFGGEGIDAAQHVGALAVLEVNAPVIDYPGSPKARLDRLLVVRPMERWRNRQVRRADLLVTPSSAIVPGWVDDDRLLELEWGADTTRFRPDRSGPAPFARDADDVVVAFAGAFRAWHGAVLLARALAELHAAGHTRFRGLFIGDGPEQAAVRAAAAGVPRTIFTGALPHDLVPSHLAHADIGAAPFDIAAHPPLQLGFYWSPLKIFEYLAAGLPVVAPNLPRIEALVGGDAGVLYEGAAPDAIAGALLALAAPNRRRAAARAARALAERKYSWRAHCAALADAFERRVARRATGSRS